MIKQGGGRVTNIGSAASIVAFPNMNYYCASRGEIVQLTKSLAAEWGVLWYYCKCYRPGMVSYGVNVGLVGKQGMAVYNKRMNTK